MLCKEDIMLLFTLSNSARKASYISERDAEWFVPMKKRAAVATIATAMMRVQKRTHSDLSILMRK